MKRYSLKIPGMAETKATLAQPTLVRLIPWAILGTWAVWLLFSVVPQIAWLYSSRPVPWTEPAMFLLVWGLIRFGVEYFLASRIKRGDMVFVWYARLTSIVSILGTIAILLQPYFFASRARPELAELSSPSALFLIHQLVNILAGAYLLYALFKYEKEIREGGESYKAEPPYDARRERLAHRLGILAIIVLPILYNLGILLWQVVQVAQYTRMTQGFMREGYVYAEGATR